MASRAREPSDASGSPLGDKVAQEQAPCKSVAWASFFLSFILAGSVPALVSRYSAGLPFVLFKRRSRSSTPASDLGQRPRPAVGWGSTADSEGSSSRWSRFTRGLSGLCRARYRNRLESEGCLLWSRLLWAVIALRCWALFNSERKHI